MKGPRESRAFWSILGGVEDSFMAEQSLAPSHSDQLAPYTELLDLVRHHKQSFQRQVTTAVYHIDHRMLAVATLQDTYHDMRMAVLVNSISQQIEDIRAVMLRYPFNVCPEAPESYRRLIGLRVYDPGTMKKIHEMIPRRDGCTHLYHVLESCLRALFIGGRGGKPSDSVYERPELDVASLEKRRQRVMQVPMLKGTCISFSKPPMTENETVQ